MEEKLGKATDKSTQGLETNFASHNHPAKSEERQGKVKAEGDRAVPDSRRREAVQRLPLVTSSFKTPPNVG